jgi:hypothetical protein
MAATGGLGKALVDQAVHHITNRPANEKPQEVVLPPGVKRE